MLRTILATLAIFAFPACSTHAGIGAGGIANVSVIDRESGRQLQIHRHKGQLYVEGRVGSRYAIHLRNRTTERILAVLSVDGINVISGQTASASQTGYVLAQQSAAQITGWRKNMNDIAAFYFTSLGDSYAARTDRPDNAGVIGVAIFRERVAPPPVSLNAPAAEIASQSPGGATRNDASAPAASTDMAKSAKREKIGTGHGEIVNSPTYHTAFERESGAPNEVIRIFYDTRENLVARGIIPEYRPSQPMPNPFPGGFVPDPRG